MNQYKLLEEQLERVNSEISIYNERHHELIARLHEVHGISKVIAEGILAEATTEMKNFRGERVFAAWSSVAPGNNESAGKKKDQAPGKAIPISKNI